MRSAALRVSGGSMVPMQSRSAIKHRFDSRSMRMHALIRLLGPAHACHPLVHPTPVSIVSMAFDARERMLHVLSNASQIVLMRSWHAQEWPWLCLASTFLGTAPPGKGDSDLSQFGSRVCCKHVWDYAEMSHTCGPTRTISIFASADLCT